VLQVEDVERRDELSVPSKERPIPTRYARNTSGTGRAKEKGSSALGELRAWKRNE